MLLWMPKSTSLPPRCRGAKPLASQRPRVGLPRCPRVAVPGPFLGRLHGLLVKDFPHLTRVLTVNRMNLST